MKATSKLRDILTENKDRLTEAAHKLCGEKELALKAVYCAVIKTKQKYKKLANKERSVDVCISLIKRPKRCGKQNFTSTEDCIDKALEAKVVPWKAIVPAVAVVLAAAILLPFCLPKKPVTIDPKGFVMEGTQALANQVEGSSIQLKNFHKISDFGVADIRELANTELNANGTNRGDARYLIHTTSNGITFLVQVYVNGETKQSEFILYRGEADGWHEVGRDTVRYRVTTLPGQEPLYEADRVLELFFTSDGTLYILSTYNEGLQIHRYSENGTLTLLDRVHVQDHKQVGTHDGSMWITPSVQVSASCDEADMTLSMICRYLVGFDELYTSIFNTCFITFDLEKEVFTAPVSAPSTSDDSALLSFGQFCVADGSGGYYISVTEDIVYSETSWDSYYYIYHYDRSGAFVEKVLYGERLKNNANTVGLSLMKVEDDALHLVYEIGNRTYYSVYRDGVEQSKIRLYSITKDDWDYMAMFFYEGNLYYMTAINNKYIAIAKVLENGSEKVAEFEVPFVFDELSFLACLGGAGFSRISITDGVLSYIIGEYDRANYGWEYVSSYFLQVVLDYEETEK